MIILAIDTSSTTASVALIDNFTVMGESSVTLADLKAKNRKTHSQTLMPMIAGLFEIVGITIEEIDKIACTCGPGSFTGLRIGAATAKGLSFASGKPLIAVPTLDAMAYNVLSIAEPDAWVIPMMDARRAQVYTALYHKGERVTDYLALPIEEVLAMLTASAKPGSRLIFLGDGAEANRDTITSLVQSAIFAPPCHTRPRAACVGAVAITMKPVDKSEFSLLYIRKPQAEREKEERAAKILNV